MLCKVTDSGFAVLAWITPKVKETTSLYLVFYTFQDGWIYSSILSAATILKYDAGCCDTVITEYKKTHILSLIDDDKKFISK